MSDPSQGEQNRSIRVLITDDHFIVRQGLCLILKTAVHI